MSLHVATSAAAFLERVEEFLVRAGAEGELTYGLLGRLSLHPDFYDEVLLVALLDAKGAPTAVVTRTDAFPLLVVAPEGLDAEQLALLVDHLAATDAFPDEVNGAEHASRAVAAAIAARTGRSLQPDLGTIAHELRHLVPPARPAAGHMEAAGPDLRSLLSDWTTRFYVEALGPGHPTSAGGLAQAESTVDRLLPNRDLMVWRDGTGAPVAMAGVNRRTPRSSTVSLVYTPPDLRGRGFASAVVHALTARELAAGQSWTSLFTDAANPTTNRIYRALGYEPRARFTCWTLS